MTLRDSGSTNLPGWTLYVYRDGSGELTSETGPRSPGHPGPVHQLRKVAFGRGTFNAGRLASGLDHVNWAAIKPDCLLSASFGAAMELIHDSKMAFVQCYIDADQTPLARELHAIVLRAVPPGYSAP